MLTRNMRVNAENRRKSYYKKIVVKWCIERFRNPSTNYQPYHNVHFGEQMLNEGEVSTAYMGPIFDFNRVVKAEKLHNILTFELVPTAQATSVDYVIDRFKSFGKQSHFQIAETLRAIIDNNSQYYTPEQQQLFPSNELIAQQYSDKMCLIVGGAFTPTGLVTDRISISERLLHVFGYNEEDFMINATKFGTISLDADDDFSMITRNCEDQILSYLRSQIEFKKCVTSNPDPVAIQEIIERNSLHCTLRIARKGQVVNWRCTFKTITPSHILVLFDEIEGDNVVQEKPPDGENPNKIEVEEGEYDVLQHLVFVPDNRLRINKPFVCRVRTFQK